MLMKDAASRPNDKIGDVVLEQVEKGYTEDAADRINEALLALIPDLKIKGPLGIPLPVSWVRGRVAKALDEQTPALPLKALRIVLAKLHLASSERQMLPSNPFR